MKGKLIYLISFLILFFSCNDKKPENHIPKDQFIKILADTYVAEGIVEYRRKLKTAQKDSLFTILMDSIYNIHEIDSLAFQENYKFYQSNLEELSSIQKAIIDTLKNRNEKLVKKKKPKKKGNKKKPNKNKGK